MMNFEGMNKRVARKIYENPGQLAIKIEDLKKESKKIVFTNGVFDLLHRGHVRCLFGAKDCGDILIVAVNTDNSVKKLGKPEPANKDYERIENIAAFEAVDYVIPMEDSIPNNLLILLKPDVHAKGTDYTLETLPERAIVEGYGGKIMFVGGPKIKSSTRIRKFVKDGKEEDKIEEKVHDFGNKLLQPSLIEKLKEYARWQKKIRNGDLNAVNNIPDFAPASINLDLTTACNFRCDYCIDSKIINQSINFEHENLLSSLDMLIKKGLKSVILIGGGEPTIYPRFEEVVSFLKNRGVQVAIVTNGSNMEKIANIAYLFDDKDWIRLSLDAGTEETFQKMHKPVNNASLINICKQVKELKERYKDLKFRYSFLITWDTGSGKVVENIDEIIAAAKLGKENGFEIFAVKPFLERTFDNSAEIINFPAGKKQEIIEKIKKALEEVKKLEDENFKIRESTNLKALLYGIVEKYKEQPKNCHIIFFRNVLSPLGTFICPSFRNIEKAKIGDKDAYLNEENYEKTKARMVNSIKDFDACKECCKTTCFYNSVNWFIEDLIANPDKLNKLEAIEDNKDYFL